METFTAMGGTASKRSRWLAAAAALLLLGAVSSVPVLLGGDEGGSPAATPRPVRRGTVVFVLDASASMRIPDIRTAGGPITRLERATRELENTLAGLRQGGEFYFDVVVCSNRVAVLSESLGRSGPLALDDGTLRDAEGFLSGRRGAGMTRLFEALEKAFRICGRAPTSLRPGSVLLYTDGIPTFGRQSRGPRNVEEFFPALREANPAGVRVNAFAVSATSEGAAFLKRLCSENGGISFSP